MSPNVREGVVVVGDRFEGITRQDGVQTLSQVLRSAQAEPDALPDAIIVGQGIGTFDLVALKTAIDECGRAPRPVVEAHMMTLATRSASHKCRPQNVLLANVTPSGELTSRADLRIENDNELLLDHQTGAHVQGMVVVEASRQMFLASTSALQLTAGLKEPYFVIQTMSTEFHSFLFPLPATLRFTAREPDRSRQDSAGFSAVTGRRGVVLSRSGAIRPRLLLFRHLRSPRAVALRSATRDSSRTGRARQRAEPAPISHQWSPQCRGFPRADRRSVCAADDLRRLPCSAQRHSDGSRGLHEQGYGACPTHTSGGSKRTVRNRLAIAGGDRRNRGAAVIGALQDISPDLGRFIVEYSFGDIYARPGLTLRERELVTVASCIALGTCVPQLQLHMHGYLNVGGTKDEVIEIVMQMAVYAGFPAALNGLNLFREVLTERDAASDRHK